MWRKEETNSQVSSEPSSSATSAKAAPGAVGSAQALSSKAPACISQGIKIKGDLMGTEDLFIDGLIEGKITLTNAALTVGPNGTVKADIAAREIVLRGIAEGKFTAEEKIQIWNTAHVHGELKAQRISIEDGAELRGKVEAGKVANQPVAGEAGSRAKKGEIKATEAPAKSATAATDAATAGAD